MLIVSVSRHTIENNLRHRRNDPPFELRQHKNDLNPQRVLSKEFHGTIRLMYDPAAPLISKAYCWIEIDEDPVLEKQAVAAAEVDAVVTKKEINLAVCEAAAVSDGA